MSEYIARAALAKSKGNTSAIDLADANLIVGQDFSILPDTTEPYVPPAQYGLLKGDWYHQNTAGQYGHVRNGFFTSTPHVGSVYLRHEENGPIHPDRTIAPTRVVARVKWESVNPAGDGVPQFTVAIGKAVNLSATKTMNHIVTSISENGSGIYQGLYMRADTYISGTVTSEQAAQNYAGYVEGQIYELDYRLRGNTFSLSIDGREILHFTNSRVAEATGPFLYWQLYFNGTDPIAWPHVQSIYFMREEQDLPEPNRLLEQGLSGTTVLTPGVHHSIQVASSATATPKFQLSDTYAKEGTFWRLVNEDASNSIDVVRDDGTTLIKTLAPSSWGDFQWDTGSSLYILTAYGSL